MNDHTLPQQNRVIVLLATYNGANYVVEQLDSIVAQTHQATRIFVRDDGSTDDTRSVVEAWQARHPGLIEIVADEFRNVGVRKNFELLLKRAVTAGDYYMFCDQDDVWLPTKVASTLAACQDAERRSNHGPVLVHTDLKVVDEQLQTLHESMWSSGGVADKELTFERLLTENWVTGCTVMINGALARLVRTVPAEAVMHDWWLALLAAASGTITTVRKPTILYRQHGRNAVGYKQKSLAKKLVDSIRGRSAKRGELVEKPLAQAAAFFEQHADDLKDPQHRSLLIEYVRLRRLGPMRRKAHALRHGVRRLSLKGTLLYYWLL